MADAEKAVVVEEQEEASSEEEEGGTKRTNTASILSVGLFEIQDVEDVWFLE